MEASNQQKKNRVRSALPKSESKGEPRQLQSGAEALAEKLRRTAQEAKRVEQVAVTLHSDVEKTEANVHTTERKLKRIERKAALLHNHIRSTEKRP